ncbi:CRISPR-associated protein Cas4 [Oceanithermus sp.]
MLEPIHVSAIQHYAFCPRQFALIHIEQVWEDNLYTERGHRAHQKVHQPGGFTREGVRVEYGLAIWSERIGLIGQADVVEFVDGVPYPVEHKVGPRKYRKADELQLTAQALCLEEMFGVEVPKGALYYRKSRKRREVAFTSELRDEVERVVAEIRELLKSQRLPPPTNDDRCRHCSLYDACMPQAASLLEHTG